MTTESKSCSNEECDFCKRDEGLRVFVNRYIFYSDSSTNDFEGSSDKEFSESNKALTEKETLKNLLNMNETSKESKVVNGRLELPTITVSANKNVKHYENLYDEGRVDGFGYAGSVLRRGYLYVFMEHLKSNAWQEYEISDSGYLKRINENNFFGPSQLGSINACEKKEPCFNIVHKANALTITIPKALEASNVYLKYSENKWSNTTRAKNKANYKDFMNVFNVPDFLKGKTQQGVFPMVSGIDKFNIDTSSFINDFEGKVGTNKELQLPNFEWNISKHQTDIKSAINYLSCNTLENVFNMMDEGQISSEDRYELDKFKQNEVINEKMKKLAEIISISKKSDDELPYLNTLLKSYTEEELNEALSDDEKLRMIFGALVAIDDPVGVIMDIGSNITNILSTDKNYDDETKTAQCIELIKTQFMGINNFPFYNEQEIFNNDRLEQEVSILNPYGAAMGGILQDKWDSELTTEERTEKELQKKAIEQKNKNADWEKNYINTLDPIKLKTANEELIKIKRIQVDRANLLDNLGMEFLSKNILDKHFTFNIEPNNPLDAITLFSCLDSILSSSKIGSKMNHFMGKKMYNYNLSSNYVLNTLALNNERIRKKIDNILNRFENSDIKSLMSTQPFGDLLNAVKSTLDNGGERIKNSILTMMSKFVLHMADFKPPVNFNGHLIVPMSVVIATQKDITYKNLKFGKNDRKAFNRAVIRYVNTTNQLMGVRGVSNSTLEKMINNHPYWNGVYKQFKLTGVASVPILELDRGYLNSLPKKYSDIFKSLTNLLDNKKDLYPPDIDFKQEAIGDPVNDSKFARFSVTKSAVATLQVWAFFSVFTDSGLTNTKDNLYEKSGRRVAASLGLLSGLVEFSTNVLRTFDTLLTKSMLLRAYNNVALSFVEGTGLRALLWRALGLVGGLIFGFYDIYNGIKELKEGETGFGFFLSLSGLFLIVGSIFIFFSMPLIGVLLIMFSIVFSVISYINKKNELLRWIKKCILSLEDKEKLFPNYDFQELKFKELLN